MNKKLLLNPEVAEIAESYLVFALTESGIHHGIAVEFKDFQTNTLGELKQKEKREEQDLEVLADQLLAVLPTGKCSPSGLNIKSPKKDVVKKLKEFFKVYKKDYTPEQLIAATKIYGELAQRNNFQHTSPLFYALVKDGVSKIAAICEDSKLVEPNADLPDTTLWI